MEYLERLNEDQKEVVLNNEGAMAVISGAGCLIGSTKIRFNRAKKGFETTLEKAYKSFNAISYKGSRKGWNKEFKTYVRSLMGGEIRLHEIEDIVYSGKKEVFEISLENGYSVTGTWDHKIMTNLGWVELGMLKGSSLVMCDTLRPVKSGKAKEKRRDKMIRGLVFYPYGAKDKANRRRVEEYRLIYDAKINRISLDKIIFILKNDKNKSKKLSLSLPKMDIHHIDEDHTNNHPDNLACLTKEAHQKLHSVDAHKQFNQGVPNFSKVIARRRKGLSKTYDICCKKPHHNFVANGMVVHNSGKTFSIVSKVTYLIQEKKVRPSRIVVCTLTNKASNEIRERVTKSVGEEKAEKIRMSTIHSLAYKTYKEAKQFYQPSFRPSKILFNDYEPFMPLLNKAKANKLGNKQVKDHLAVIRSLKTKMVTPQAYRAEIHLDETLEKYEGNLEMLNFNECLYYTWVDYEKYLAKHDKMDFQDILINCYKTIANPKYDDFLRDYSRKMEYLIVDEAQDTTELSFKIFDELRKYNKNICLVGDLRQCQPEGNVVRLSSGKEVDISKVTVGDEVWSYDRKCAYFRKGEKIEEMEVRKYTGSLYKFKIGETQVSSTDTHKYVTKWNVDKKSTNLHCVYLMRRGANFRIGWCKLFEKTSNFHLNTRCRFEEADAWILKITETKDEASVWESIIATNYGLPLFMFNPINGNRIYTKENLNFMWSSLKGNYERGIKVLKNFNKSEHHPLHTYKSGLGGHRKRATVFETVACNLEPKYMSLPVLVESKKQSMNRSWKSIDSICIEKVVDLPVYSLSVSGTRAYVTNGGVGVQNCIFSFAGAYIDNIPNFVKRNSPKIVDLKTNYRSTQVIVENANHFISSAKIVMGKPSITPNDVGDKIVYRTAQDDSDEAEWVIDRIEQLLEGGENPNEIAVVYRINSQSRQIEDYLIFKDIPYISYSEQAFYQRKETKDLLAYLKIMTDPSDIKPEELKRIANRPLRYIKNEVLEDIETNAFENDTDFYTAAKNHHYPSQYQENAVLGLMDDIYKGNRMISEGKTPMEVIEFVLKNIGYEKWANDEKKLQDAEADVTMNLDAVMTSSARFQTIPEFLKFIALVAKKDKEKKDENGDYIRLMTVHRAKGKEFKHVFIIGVCDRCYPFYKSRGDSYQEEEEKRIMYVAVTRPKTNLYLSVINGMLGSFKVKPSPFLQSMKITYNGNTNEF